MENLQIRRELIDDYDHINDNLEYIIENILQNGNGSDEYKNLQNDFQATLNNNCKCTSDKCDSDCLHGGNYELKDNQLVLKRDRKCMDVIYECNDSCSCTKSCLNKLVQYGPINCLEIRNFKNKGYGLIATRPLIEGTFICEYAGEILTKTEAARRDISQKSMNYILCLNEISIGSDNGRAIQTFIDPSHKGNIGRYLNHSCEPNCMILSVRTDSVIPKVAIFAKRDIRAYEELTFSYGSVDKNQDGANKKLCLCGSKNCQTYLPNLSFL